MDNIIEKRIEVIQAHHDTLRVVDEISRELRKLSRRIDKYVADLDDAWDLADEFDFDKGVEDARKIIKTIEGDMRVTLGGIVQYKEDFSTALYKCDKLPTLEELSTM